MIVIIDYGVGNLHSIKSALDKLGIENKVSKDKKEIDEADGLILPGVGAFGDAIDSLEKTGLIPNIKSFVAEGKPLLGICLGAQLLYEESLEHGSYKGLGFIKGKISPIRDDLTTNLKVPHMGWNKLEIKKQDPILKYVSQGESVYFVHSYYIKSNGVEHLTTSEYEIDIPGVVKYGNVYGMQFHPEKSGKTGLNLLKAFGELI